MNKKKKKKLEIFEFFFSKIATLVLAKVEKSLVVRKNFVHQSHRHHRRRRVSLATMELNRFTTVATRARVIEMDRRYALCVLVHQMMYRQLIIRVLTKYFLLYL